MTNSVSDFKDWALDAIQGTSVYRGDHPDLAEIGLQEALIYATLYAAEQTAALVEQTRIANVIALSEPPHPGGINVHRGGAWHKAWADLGLPEGSWHDNTRTAPEEGFGV